MKSSVSFCLFPFLLVSLFLVGCGDPQSQATKELESRGYSAAVRDLIVAAGAGDNESLDLFEQAGVPIDSTDAVGNTALIRAASAGREETVEKILGMGADPRHVNGVGRDALISASAMGYAEVARMLSSRGADPALRDSEGWSALSIAAYNGHADTVSLLSAQASPEDIDDALLVASFGGDLDVLRTLLGQGANINARSPEGKTPLMIASNGGKAEAVRLFLQNQANPYSEDNDGRTAANLAELSGYDEIKQLIMEPDQWGSTPESLELLEEMAMAKDALDSEEGVEETLAARSGELAEASASTAAAAAGQPAGTSGGSEPPAAGPNYEVGAASAGSPAATRPAAQEAPVADSASGGGLSKTSSVSPAVAPGRRVQLRKEAKSKPVVALNGSTIHSRSPETAPVQSMILAAYHEEPLPIAVENVDGNSAEIRRLDQDSGAPVTVKPGTVIPGTPYEVKEVTRKFVDSKEGQGRMVDVSRVKVENRESGVTHLLVKDIAGESSDTYAILTAPNSQYRYAVKPGDVFRTSQPGTGVKDYQVLDIRAGGVVVKDLATDQVLTIARDGVIAPQ